MKDLIYCRYCEGPREYYKMPDEDGIDIYECAECECECVDP